jgi:integrase
MPPQIPSLPFPGFPLRPHKNGQWYKSVWNPRTKRSEQHYFGPWRNDPKGYRAINDSEAGWLARQQAIKAGTDNVRVIPVAAVVTLGDLMGRFLAFKRGLVVAGDLSPRTLGDYFRETEKFVTFLKPRTPAESLGPEHFSAYMKFMIEDRKLGRYARRRVRTYINTMLKYGAKNGWYVMPCTGADWISPATDSDSVRQAKLRAGVKDYSERIVDGVELNKLLARAQPAFKAIILLGVNAGLGPADIGRLRWNMIDLDTGRMKFPRPKTGAVRCSYLWKKTRRALRVVRTLKQNRLALERDGESSLVFITRRGVAYYREREVHKEVEIEGRRVKKLVGISIENAVSITFRRMAKEWNWMGFTFTGYVTRSRPLEKGLAIKRHLI